MTLPPIPSLSSPDFRVRLAWRDAAILQQQPYAFDGAEPATTADPAVVGFLATAPRTVRLLDVLNALRWELNPESYRRATSSLRALGWKRTRPRCASARPGFRATVWRRPVST